MPGVQGRFEWGLPTVQALEGLGRVITYSLADEPTSGFAWQASKGFDNYIERGSTTSSGTPGPGIPCSVGIVRRPHRHRGRCRGAASRRGPRPGRRVGTTAGMDAA
ncbi:MAG: hypothetical protein R2708_00195 [Vicinamibacterales bacterium]